VNHSFVVHTSPPPPPPPLLPHPHIGHAVLSLPCPISHVFCFAGLPLLFSSASASVFIAEPSPPPPHAAAAAASRPTLHVPRALCPQLRISSVSCGLSHCLMVAHGGQLWGMGSNRFGQLGLGHCNHAPQPTPVARVSRCAAAACGAAFSLVVCSDGAVHSCGSNENMQLGRHVTPPPPPSPPPLAAAAAARAASPAYDFIFRPLSIALGPGGSWGRGGEEGAGEGARAVPPPQVRCPAARFMLCPATARISTTSAFLAGFVIRGHCRRRI
jgi:hypothetical protein